MHITDSPTEFEEHQFVYQLDTDMRMQDTDGKI